MRLLIANWKSNKDAVGVRQWLDTYHKLQSKIDPSSNDMEDLQVVLAPSFVHSSLVADFLTKHQFQIPTVLALQDISSFPAGSYTGAVSGQNVVGFDVTYVLVGHSERRRYFHETHADVAAKVDQALDFDITPIVCVDRGYIKDQAVVIQKEAHAKMWVAYEPVDAIGSGNNQDVGTVSEVVKEVHQAFGQVPVLYGGSVDDSNVAQYGLVTRGVLVGSASLDVQQFFKLVLKVI